jgi:carbamoyltransferase
MGAVLNTSFNMHGEPIVCSPEDALKTFRNVGLDVLVIEGFAVHGR